MKKVQLPESHYKLHKLFINYSIVFGVLLGMLFTFEPYRLYRVRLASLALSPNANFANGTLSENDLAALEFNGITVLSTNSLEKAKSPLVVTGKVNREIYDTPLLNAILVDDSGQVLNITQIDINSDDSIADFQTSIEFENPQSETGSLFFESGTTEDDTEIATKAYKFLVKFDQADVAGAQSDRNNE